MVRRGDPVIVECKDSRDRSIPVRTFTTIPDRMKKVTTAFCKNGDCTIFRAFAAGLVMNFQIIAGYGFVL